MFKGKMLKKIKKGNRVVPFCEECNSQDIETIQYCRKCGSKKIKVDWQDERSMKECFEDKEIHMYICDCCGAEFEGFK